MNNNPPDKLVSLTKEQHQFLLDNCDKNIAFGLANLQSMPRPTAYNKLVEILEQFKGIKKALQDAE